MATQPVVIQPNLIFDCKADYRDIVDIGVIKLSVTLSGTWRDINLYVDPIVITVLPDGDFIEGLTLEADIIEIIFAFWKPEPHFRYLKRNWVKWSNIGSLDFTIWKNNIAGERPLDWSGWVYGIRKLGKGVIAYGFNGVTLLTPQDNKYAMNTIHPLGVIGRNAFTGDENTQFFIDSSGGLYSVTDKLEFLGYTEFLGKLNSNTVMSIDKDEGLIYICDGELGFVYSIADKSLGTGPNNITGIWNKDGNTYISAPTKVGIPKFEIWLDTIDTGERVSKIIESVEIGTSLGVDLESAIEFKVNKNSDFARLPWKSVGPGGVAHHYCYGIEFRIGFRTSSYAKFEIDYIKINGVLNDL
jgi:hypothetical protein